MPANTLASNREQLTFDRVQQRAELIAKNVLVADPRRQRPYWFDGRFLAASDLRHEQDYFLQRQADLGRAGGEGVAEGLLVTEGIDDNTTEVFVIEPGFGFTDTGELVTVTVPDKLKVNPADVPRTQQLDAAFGLEVIPNTPGFTRTGLFVLALRPVEWTANSIAAYPTSLNGQRHTEDADIIEASAVTLIPWPDKADELSWERRRSQAARDIFVAERQRGLASGTLPLALVALRGNLIEWVDPFLVRRELGADRREGLDFGFGRRPLREAHLLQYEQQLGELLTSDASGHFAATDHFDALPPAGRMPAGAIEVTALTQRFFPRGIDVQVSFVPEDEIPALVEESFLLPPIDLTVGEKGLIGISVLVLAPLARAGFNQRHAALAGKSWQLAFVDPELKAEATPFELLFARTPSDELREAKLLTLGGAADAAAETEWRELLRTASAAGTLWFIRRRHLPAAANEPGASVSAMPAELASPRELFQRLTDEPKLAEALAHLNQLDVPEIKAFTRRLADRKFLDNPALLRGILTPFTTKKKLNAAAVLAALAPAVDPEFGAGLNRVPKSKLAAKLAKPSFARTGSVAEVDRLLRAVPAEKLEELHHDLEAAASKPETLVNRLPELRKKFIEHP